MGTRRNGARTHLDLAKRVCELSRLPGFRAGIIEILGDGSTAYLSAFDIFCVAVDALIAADNFYNRIDTAEEVANSEDITFA